MRHLCQCLDFLRHGVVYAGRAYFLGNPGGIFCLVVKKIMGLVGDDFDNRQGFEVLIADNPHRQFNAVDVFFNHHRVIMGKCYFNRIFKHIL